MSSQPPSNCKTLIAITGAYAFVWLVCLADWKWFTGLPKLFDASDAALSPPDIIYGVVLGAAIPIGALWLLWSFRSARDTVVQLGVASVCYVPLWQFVLFLATLMGAETVRAYTARIGTGGLFLIGLLWLIRYVEKTARRYEIARMDDPPPSGPSQAIWNPLDPDACYYGRRQKRLNQSVFTLISYSFTFMLAFLVLTQMGGCAEEYLLPAGGGEQTQITPMVKIKKIIRKKFVLNPLSAIIWNPPPIEKTELNINELTKHFHTIGYGKGTGAGFAGGDRKGKVRFIRLEYDGGDWNQGMGIGADLNMLLEYNLRTKQPVAKKTESMRIARLSRFAPLASPPVVYITGQRSLSVSKSDVKVLKQYLLEKHGMLFASAGSGQFHSRFMALMAQLLPTTRAVPIPLDDPIHKFPYQIPFFPYVAAHGGNQALGWKVEGRWVAYYHPGDIGDAWTDGHSGVKPTVWEACYQLGCNVIYYAHREHAVWRESRGKK